VRLEVHFIYQKKFASNLGEVFGGKFALNASKKFALFLAGRHFY
jgi:hypothetical protein